MKCDRPPRRHYFGRARLPPINRNTLQFDRLAVAGPLAQLGMGVCNAGLRGRHDAEPHSGAGISSSEPASDISVPRQASLTPSEVVKQTVAAKENSRPAPERWPLNERSSRSASIGVWQEISSPRPLRDPSTPFHINVVMREAAYLATCGPEAGFEIPSI